MNKANNRQDAVNGRHATNVVERHAVAVSDSLSKPMFLSEQFEDYLNLFDADIGGRVQRCVDAQELHRKLGVGKDFTSWIKVRIGQEELVDGVDYSHTRLVVTVPHSTRGTQVIQKPVYTLTLETAKIIAAMERNETGRKIRKWLDQLMIQTAVAQAVVAVPAAQPALVSDSLFKPMFLSEQFEAYLKVVEMELDGRVQRLVDLRSLHEKLGVRDNYRDWAPRSLTNSRSVEGVHYSPRVDPRAVPHSSGRAQKQVSKDYYVCFEKAKIIAARSNAENSLDICEWLVRVEEQARQTHTASPALSRIELLEMALVAERRAEAERQRADDAMHKALGLETKIATNTLYPKVAPEPGKAHISIKDIKAEYAPYLSEPKIRLVLRFYGQGRTRFQFGAHENAFFQTFQRAGLEEVFDEFLKDCQHRMSGSRTSVILDHECFDGETARVPKNLAIEHLGYAEDDFAS